MFKQRIKKLQNNLSDRQAILLSKTSDISYFSSFHNSVPEERNSFLLITPNKSHLLLQDFLPIPENFPGKTIYGTSLRKIQINIKKLQEELGFKELFVDADNLFLAEYQSLREINQFDIYNLNRKLIWDIRIKKDKKEIEKLNKAFRISKKSLKNTLSNLNLNQTELEIANFFEKESQKLKGEGLAFETIVAFDQNSALPHHQSNSSKLKKGTIVLIDCGVTYQGYCSDITRTIFFYPGWNKYFNPDYQYKNQEKLIKILEKKDPQLVNKFKKFLEIEKIVRKSYQEADRLLKSKKEIKNSDLDLACRNYIKDAGYGNQFIHTSGHGLGLDIHEPPSIYHQNQKTLKKGTAITIEPGIYFPGEFGYRYENTLIY